MVSRLKVCARCVNWKVLMSTTLVTIVVVSIFVSASALRAAPRRAQKTLLELAQQQPKAQVSIIVQKTARDSRVEELVARLGGKVTTDLNIINAFAAEMRANQVLQLAQADGVRWISLDVPVAKSACADCVDTANLQNAYIYAVGADRVWNEALYLQGQGIGVPIVHSRISDPGDFGGGPGTGYRVEGYSRFGRNGNPRLDLFGHGTHIAGIVGGNGRKSDGAYIGVAPSVNLVAVKVTDDEGAGNTSDVVRGLQWVLNNKDRYNIRVVNISLNSSVAESYDVDPLDAAVEILWFNKIVVVVSAGNNGLLSNGILYPPANDPFVITVGAADDRGTANVGDDVLASFSPSGKTTNGFNKPDLVAPGKNIVSTIPNNRNRLEKEHPSNAVDKYYFRMSGTSMASAVTSGAVALLLQAEPNLNPDQAKYRLMATARPFGPGAGAGYIDIYSAVHGTTTTTANTGMAASQLLWTGANPPAWDSVTWNSVTWNSVTWNSDYWGP
jgi:serine protease AprX